MTAELWTQLIVSAPSAVAVIVTVRIFMVYIDKRDKRADERMSAIADECHGVQRESHDCMRETVVALGQITEVMRKFNGRVES